MCGIVGIHNRFIDPANVSKELAKMNQSQFHRGPDGDGYFVDPSIGFGMAMRRLSIIDLATGIQPMYSQDRRYSIVYNGEIMNAPELRREMESDGERFITNHSDTEVLFKLLCRNDITVLKKVNGMFAFAFYDSHTKKLTIGHDRFGIKPVYYSQIGGKFYFASELKSLLTQDEISRDIDHQSLFHYLSLMYVPGPSTIFKDVKKLKPGAVLTYSLQTGEVKIEHLLKINYEPDYSVKEREWSERIYQTLSGAVNRWALSDVPIACSLSGGLDSSSIVGFLAQSGTQVLTYSLGFTGKNESKWNELHLAAEVAKKWGTKHHELELDPKSMLTDLLSMVWHLDEPYGGGLPSWLVFKRMSQDVKVCLTGTGGDELFGNYGKWLGLEGNLFKRPIQNHDNFQKLFFERYYYFPDKDKRSIFLQGDSMIKDTSSFLFEHYLSCPSDKIRDRCAYTDINTQLTDEFLLMTDRFSMAHSLEARPPFLDNDLVNLVTSIPASMRTKKHDLKGLLRSSVSPLLPESLKVAPKKGFVIPLQLWLRNELRPLVEYLLAPERLVKQGIFKPELFRFHILPFLEGKSNNTTRVFGLVMFQLWYDQFIDKTDGVGLSGNELLDRFIK